MALYSLLRRAHLSATPLALRVVRSAASDAGSSFIFRSCSSPPLLTFSTAIVEKKKRSWTDDTLIRVIDSEIKSAHDSVLHDSVVDIPADFPFKIQDRAGYRIIMLERKYEEEEIRVVLDLCNAGCEENVDSEYDGENKLEPSIPMVVTISKENGMSLHVDARAFPDRISVQGLSVTTTEIQGNQLVYEGPVFSDLDKNLRVAFQKYLEVRGLTSGTAKFLLEYIITKDTKEYARWLKKFKKFFG